MYLWYIVRWLLLRILSIYIFFYIFFFKSKGASTKLLQLNQFHVGDVVTTLQKTSMVAGAAEVLLYGTVHGALGALIPLLTRSDVVRTALYSKKNRRTKKISHKMNERDLDETFLTLFISLFFFSLFLLSLFFSLL